MVESICFVSPRAYGYFDPSVGYTGGGAERQIYLLSRALGDGYDVSVVVGDYGQPATETRDGVTLQRAYELRPRAHPLQPVQHAFVLWNAMRRADADVYVIRDSRRKAAVVSLLAHTLGSGWIYHVANDRHADQRTASGAADRLFAHRLPSSAAVVAQTERQRSLLSRTYGVDATVVPNGYQPVAEPAPHRNREAVLWVGTLDRTQKRPHLYLDLAERCPDVQFRLVGPVDRSSEYQRRIAERADALSNVTFVGAVSPGEIHEEYRRAVALVNTSAYEGFPNTFLEAWRQATPVASLAVDPRRFVDTDWGYADGDLDALAGIIETVWTDTEQRARLGQRARANFESSYTDADLVEGYEAVLSSID